MDSLSKPAPLHLSTGQDIPDPVSESNSILVSQPVTKAPFVEPILIKQGSIPALTTDFGVNSYEVQFSPGP